MDDDVDAALAAALAAVADADAAVGAAAAVGALVDAVEAAARDERMEALRAELRGRAAEAEEEVARWAEAGPAVEDRRSGLEQEASAAIERLEWLGEGRARAAAEEARQRARRDRLRRRRDELAAGRDLTLLPPAVLRYAAGFFRPRELARATSVCRRWRHALDRGFLWKVMLLQHDDEARKRRADEVNNQVQVQRHVRVDLDSAGAGRSLDKATMFQLGSEVMQQRFMDASGEREDIRSRRDADREVIYFLEEKADGLRHELGLAAVAVGAWNTRIERTSRAKADLSRRATELEARLTKARDERASLEVTAREAAHEDERRIQMLSELRELSELSRTPEERERDEVARAQAKEMRAQKRVLVKAVKSLRVELDAATKARDAYRVKLARAKESGGGGGGGGGVVNRRLSNGGGGGGDGNGNGAGPAGNGDRGADGAFMDEPLIDL